MTIFLDPQGLTEIAHFKLAEARTWGTPIIDGLFKERIRSAANLGDALGKHSFYVFSIRCIVGNRRRRKVGPDVENIPKLIVDAFTGILYPDDNLDYVRAVQVEANFGPDEQECTEVWIYAG